MTGDSILKHLAVHEGGHAVALQALGFQGVQVLFISPEGGKTVHAPYRLASDNHIARIIIALLAGDEAEALLFDWREREAFPGGSQNEWGADGRRSDEYLNRLGGDVHAKADRARELARLILARDLALLREIRDYLIQNGSMAVGHPLLKKVQPFAYTGTLTE